MIEYRLAEPKDKDECVKLCSNAFFDYDFHKIVCTENEDLRFRFHEAVFEMAVKLGIKKQHVYLMLEDQKIIAVAQFRSQNEKDYSILDFIKSNILNIIKTGGLRNGLKYLELVEKNDKPLKKITGKHRYLISFAVLKELHGKGVGSKMLQDFVIPHLKQTGNNLLSVVTNSQSNFNFYVKNGFELYSQSIIRVNKKDLGNWVLTRKL